MCVNMKTGARPNPGRNSEVGGVKLWWARKDGRGKKGAEPREGTPTGSGQTPMGYVHAMSPLW